MICRACHSEFPVGSGNACPHDGSDLIPAQADPLIGTTFAERYEILARVGKGGMGVVYKARQKYMEVDVAIKVLYKEHTSNQVAIDRFQQEAKTLATLKHPNILHIVDFGITPNHEPFLIMEFLQGTALDDYLEQKGTMAIKRALEIFLQACDGLAYAHSKGVIHRDLKPGNLLLTVDEFDRELVKIVDFGIAKMKPQEGKEEQHLTKAGEIFGSPLYMSPEQCQGKPLDERSDIYALACVIYETLTGMPPLMGVNSFETMTMHVNEKPLTMRGTAPELKIPELIDAVIMKALSKDAKGRPKTMAQLKYELADAAKKSNIYLESPVSDYQPKPFLTGEFQALDGSQTTGPTPPVVQGVPCAEVHEMVQTAVNAARMEAAIKQKRIMSVSLVIFALLLSAFTMMMIMPGPKEDPAPAWQKLIWRWAMEAGDRDEAENRIDNAISDYNKAKDIGKEMSPIYDKELKAQLKLVELYQKYKPGQVDQLRREMLLEHLQRMIALFGDNTPDLPALTQIDSGMISGGAFNPKQLDAEFADKYANMLIDQAKRCMTAKKYMKAESWLLQAIQFEEKAHSKSLGNLCECAEQLFTDCSNDPAAKRHLPEIENLLKRAHAAESGEPAAVTPPGGAQ
jgi:serine/threonine-protein kinase